jgi:predicted flap endonuclease-1-like 5' DNA nuclease
VGAAESALAESHAELDGARGRLTELEAQLSERDSTLVELNAKVAAREESSRQLAEQNEQAERALTEQVSEQSGELESLAAQLREASEQAGAAEAELEQKAVELTELQGSLSSAEERLPELEQTLQSITDERDQLTHRLGGLEADEATAVSKNESLLELEGALDERDQRIDALLSDMAQKDEDLGEVNAEATLAGQRCEQLEAELKGLQAKLVEFEGGLADSDSTAQGQVAELQQLVGERTAQLQELQTEVTDQTRCLEETTNEVAIKDELVAELERKLEQHSLDTARTSSGDAVAPPGTVAPEHQAVVRELDDRKRQITRLEREQGLQQQTMQVLSQQLEDARQTHDRLSGTIADREARISELESDGGADGQSDAAQPGFLLESRPDDCDDLQRIRGIGTALEKALNELGIYRLRQIAALNDADIKWLDGSLKGFKGRIIRDAWIDQADELSFGDRPLDQP